MRKPEKYILIKALVIVWLIYLLVTVNQLAKKRLKEIDHLQYQNDSLHFIINSGCIL